MRTARACSVLFLAAFLAACSQSVEVGDGTDVKNSASNDINQLAADLLGRWQGDFADPVGTPVPMLLTLTPGPGPRSLYFQFACATTSVCPITDFGAFFGTAFGADAGLSAGEFPTLELQLLEFPDDGGTRANSVLRVNPWVALLLRVSLSLDQSVLHISGPDDVRADFMRSPGPEPDGGSAAERSSQ